MFEDALTRTYYFPAIKDAEPLSHSVESMVHLLCLSNKMYYYYHISNFLRSQFHFVALCIINLYICAVIYPYGQQIRFTLNRTTIPKLFWMSIPDMPPQVQSPLLEFLVLSEFYVHKSSRQLNQWPAQPLKGAITGLTPSELYYCITPTSTRKRVKTILHNWFDNFLLSFLLFGSCKARPPFCRSALFPPSIGAGIYSHA